VGLQFLQNGLVRTALKSSVFAGRSAALSPGQMSQQPGFLPFYLIESVAVGIDVVLIAGTSVLTGIAYRLTFSHLVTSTGVVTDQALQTTTLIAIGGLTSVLFAAMIAARGAYRPQALINFRKQTQLATIVWLFVFFVLSLMAFAFKVSSTYSRGATLTYFVIGWTAITAWRLVLARYITRSLTEGRFAQQKVLLLAEEGQFGGLSIVEDLRRCGYLPLKTFEFAYTSLASGRNSLRLRSSLDEIVEISRREQIECVFIVASWDQRPLIEELIEQLSLLSVSVYLLPDKNVAHFLGRRIVEIGTTWTAELKRAPLSRVEQACKRALDLLIASVGVILLTPMMLLVAAAIKIESRGSIFFVQTRNGFNGRPFRMCKFRTMSVLEDGPLVRHVTKNDPRVTPFGYILRRTHIDEMLQLFNVLAGSMSLVGPRPHASALNSEYERTVANYAFRYHVKPGLTGWAQINGLRGEMELDRVAKRVEYDLWYINNWSFWLDLKILFRTLTIGLRPDAF
jgi:Undecaprenyl-phosphate glucose phosphotransferase